MRLIDADLLEPDAEYDDGEFWAVSMSQIENAPTIELELIRCKECKHSEHWYRDKARCFLWHEEGIDVFEDGYCSYAERKEGETE